MYLDALNQFSDAQAITAAAASTNVIDLGINRDIGTGQVLYLALNVDVAMTDSGSDSTVTVALEGDSTESFTPDGTQNLFIILATSAIGVQHFHALDPGSPPLQFQFIRLLYTPNNGNLTAGSFTAGLAQGIDKWTAYANGYTITG